MKKNPGNDIPADIEALFKHSSDTGEVNHRARMIMFRFFSEVEKQFGQKRGLKKKIAKSIGKSSSYITQLFNGDKLVNLITLAKIEKEFDIEFEVKARSERKIDLSKLIPSKSPSVNFFIFNFNEKNETRAADKSLLTVQESPQKEISLT